MSGNPWAQVADIYGQGLDRQVALTQANLDKSRSLPEFFMQGFMSARERAEQERMARAQEEHLRAQAMSQRAMAERPENERKKQLSTAMGKRLDTISKVMDHAPGTEEGNSALSESVNGWDDIIEALGGEKPKPFAFPVSPDKMEFKEDYVPTFTKGGPYKGRLAMTSEATAGKSVAQGNAATSRAETAAKDSKTKALTQEETVRNNKVKAEIAKTRNEIARIGQAAADARGNKSLALGVQRIALARQEFERRVANDKENKENKVLNRAGRMFMPNFKDPRFLRLPVEQQLAKYKEIVDLLDEDDSTDDGEQPNPNDLTPAVPKVK